MDVQYLSKNLTAMICKASRSDNSKPPINREKLLKSMGMGHANKTHSTAASKPRQTTPAGTTQSYLAAQSNECEEKCLSYALIPKFDDSGLSFTDLFYDYKKSRVNKSSGGSKVSFICFHLALSLSDQATSWKMRGRLQCLRGSQYHINENSRLWHCWKTNSDGNFW